METVELLSEIGMHVATIKIPPFVVMPEVIVWGNRAFVRSVRERGYREAFSYVAPMTDERVA